jgi:hypothetical protein
MQHPEVIGVVRGQLADDCRCSRDEDFQNNTPASAPTVSHCLVERVVNFIP